MHIYVAFVVLLVFVAHSGMAGPEGHRPRHNDHSGGHPDDQNGEDLPMHRAKRQTGCDDQWDNCGVDTEYQGTTIKATFPGGQGCTSVADTPSYMVENACQCEKTCPAFCGASVCGDAGNVFDSGNQAQGCVDYYNNCAADEVDSSGRVFKAIFPGESGCESMASTPSNRMLHACNCKKSCPAFCGAPDCN